MAISNDWTNKSLKIQQIDREQKARRAGMREGMQNVLMMIAGGREPNEEDAPYRERPPGGKPWEGYPKPYQPKLAHGEGRGPQQKFHDEYNIPLDKPPWRHINPRGEPIDIEWQKKEYLEEHPELMISHVNKDGTAHSGGPEHDFMHGRRGTNTWPDGRRKYSDEELKRIDEYMKSLMISQSPAALDALRKGKAPGLSSQQIRSLIKPFTKPDQFGHPTGSLRV